MTGSGGVPGAGSGTPGACRGFTRVGMGSVGDGGLWGALGQGHIGGLWGGGDIGVPSDRRALGASQGLWGRVTVGGFLRQRVTERGSGAGRHRGSLGHEGAGSIWRSLGQGDTGGSGSVGCWGHLEVPGAGGRCGALGASW